MDLLKELSKKINFTYSLALSPDGQFGNYIIKNTSSITVNHQKTLISKPYQCCSKRKEGVDWFNRRIS